MMFQRFFAVALALSLPLIISGQALAQSIFVPAEYRDVVMTMDTIGKVVPAESAEISPTRNMVIEKFLVGPGQIVRKGQKLAEISLKSVAQELQYLKPYREILRRNVELTKINLEVANQKLDRTTILANKGIVKAADLDRADKALEANIAAPLNRELAALSEAQDRVVEASERLARRAADLSVRVEQGGKHVAGFAALYRRLDDGRFDDWLAAAAAQADVVVGKLQASHELLQQ